jgi:hypothetical protein
MYSRDEIKALADSVLNMAKADAVEVDFNGGERSGTRWANSTMTDNLVQLDQQVSVIVRLGQKTGSASTRERRTSGATWMRSPARSRGRCTARAATPRGSRRRPTASRTASPFLRIKKMMVGVAYA